MAILYRGFSFFIISIIAFPLLATEINAIPKSENYLSVKTSLDWLNEKTFDRLEKNLDDLYQHVKQNSPIEYKYSR
ncbi:MAG: hypothetical protein LBS40_06085 [Burkholderiales bacterium]|nr:hypothetical protein [Burkholderiales bacterium]